MEGNVDGKVLPGPATVVFQLSGAGEEVVLVFVERNSHDSVGVPECEFHSVAVMYVDVDVENPGMSTIQFAQKV